MCAYLKAHYPIEFFCELFSARCDQQFEDWAAAAKQYHQEFQARQGTVLGPNINRSQAEFSINSDNKIIFGLGAIKNIGINTAFKIIQARGDNKFTDIWDFIFRCSSIVNTRVFATLAIAGAFDGLGYTRKELATKTEEIFNYYVKYCKWLERTQALEQAIIVEEAKKVKQAEIENRIAIAKQNKKAKTLSIEDTFWLERADRIKRYKEIYRQCELNETDVSTILSYDEINEYTNYLNLRAKPLPKPGEEPIKPELDRARTIKISLQDIIAQEQVLGMWVSKHPLDVLFPNATTFKELEIDDTDFIPCIVVRIKEITTKKGQQMAFISMQDKNMIVEGTVFPNVWNKQNINEGDIIEAYVKCENTDPYKFIVNAIVPHQGAQ